LGGAEEKVLRKPRMGNQPMVSPCWKLEIGGASKNLKKKVGRRKGEPRIRWSRLKEKKRKSKVSSRHTARSAAVV